MADRPDVVVFDVLETLLNLDPLAARLDACASWLNPRWILTISNIESIVAMIRPLSVLEADANYPFPWFRWAELS